MLIDVHAHLQYKDFENDLDDVIKRAEEVGVKAIIMRLRALLIRILKKFFLL